MLVPISTFFYGNHNLLQIGRNKVWNVGKRVYEKKVEIGFYEQIYWHFIKNEIVDFMYTFNDFMPQYFPNSVRVGTITDYPSLVVDRKG